MRRSLELAGALCGVLALLVFLVMYLMAVSRDDEYGVFDSYLSELGIGPGGVLFNVGLALICPLGAVFAVLGLRPALAPSLSREVGVVLFVVACAFGVLAGVFPMDEFEAHAIATWGTFVSLWSSLVLVSYAMGIDDPLGRRMTELTRSLVVAGVLLAVLGGNPLGEVLVVVLLGTWMVAFTYLRLAQLLSVSRPRTAAGT